MKKFVFFILFLSSFYPGRAQQTVGLFLNDSLAFNGYTLMAPESNITYLIDNCGYVVNSWETEQRPGKSAYLLENGNLLRTGNINGAFNGGGSGGRLEILNWDGDLVWRYDYASDLFHQHHDVALLPNGNILVLAWELHTAQDAIENGRNSVATSPNGVWSEQIVELEPVGSDQVNIIWEWHLWDHLIQDFDSTLINYGVIADHPELLDINFGANNMGPNSTDWIHLNSINYNPDLDQIVVGSRNLDEFWIIDHSTTTEEAASHNGGNADRGGDILYRWGNPQTYQTGTAEDQKLFGQHDVQWIPSGLSDEGKILIFNNGFERPDGNYSTIDIIEPPVDSEGNYMLEPGQAYGPENLFWTFSNDAPQDFYARNISGVQRLPNGNTLICSGPQGLVFEITPDQSTVWEYQNSVRTVTGPVPQGTNVTNAPVSLFRAYRYGPDYPAFEGRDLTPGEPIELEPIAYDCTIHEAITAIADLEQVDHIRVIENPVFNTLKIENESSELIHFEVFSLNGKLMDRFSSSDFILERDISHWTPGMYIVRGITTKNTFYSTKIIKL